MKVFHSWKIWLRIFPQKFPSILIMQPRSTTAWIIQTLMTVRLWTSIRSILKMNDCQCCTRADTRNVSPAPKGEMDLQNQFDLAHAEPEPAQIPISDVESVCIRYCPCRVHMDCRKETNLCLRDSLPNINNSRHWHEEVFNRWSTVYDMTTGRAGQQVLEQRADCRRKPFYPRCCGLCEIVNEICLLEQRHKRCCKLKLQPLRCDGDYTDSPTTQHAAILEPHRPSRGNILR